MKFTVEREHLLKPLQQVSGPLGGRPTLPILGNLLLQVADGALSLTGTDLEMEMVARVALLQPHEPGATTVPARKFFDICRGLPEGAEIAVQLEGDRMLVRSGRSRFSLSTLPAADFPNLDDWQSEVEFTLPQATMKRLIEATQFSMAHQDVRYVFLGSKTHMLKRMFGEKSRPFYKSAATMRLDKPPEDESLTFVRHRFASRSIGIDEAAARRIVSETENVPYYLQELSSQVFDAVVAAGRGWVEDADIDAGIAGLMSENTDYYVEKLSMLSGMQRLLVAALAAEPVREFTEDYRAHHSLGGSSTVHTALKAVIEKGIVESEPDGYFIGDPFFARYVRN